jgi:hypothetical protein
MYRDSVDTLERSVHALRTDNERLRSDLDAARRLAGPRRWLRLAGAIGWLGVLVLAGLARAGHARAARDVEMRHALNEECRAKLDAQDHETARRYEEELGASRLMDRCLREAWWPYQTASICSEVVWSGPPESMSWHRCQCR